MCNCTETFLTTRHWYIDWPMLQRHMYVDHLLWPKAFLPFGYHYDKPEVKGNVFHCLWRQETKLFAQMSLSNVGMTLVPHSSYLGYSIGLETPFYVPFAALLSFPPCDSVVLWECWEGLEILSPPPHKGTVICSVIKTPLPLPQAVSLSLSDWTPCILDNHLWSFFDAPITSQLIAYR